MGGQINESLLLSGGKHEFTFIARENCSLLTLSKADYERITQTMLAGIDGCPSVFPAERCLDFLRKPPAERTDAELVACALFLQSRHFFRNVPPSLLTMLCRSVYATDFAPQAEVVFPDDNQVH